MLSLPERTQSFLNAPIAICIGLVPVLHLPALQIATLLILISVLLKGRAAITQMPKPNWPFLLLIQFALYFMANALLYRSMEGNMSHFQRVAIESWAMTLVGVALMWPFVGYNRNFFAVLHHWVPPALILAFLVMSYFFFGSQGPRAQAYSTNALVPPIWLLSLTLICFCDFFDLSRRAQALRLLLLICASRSV